MSIESLELRKQSATISDLKIGNPPRFQTPNAFTARSIDITTTFNQLRANPLVIDEIVMDDLNIYLESLKNNDTNWNQILAHHHDGVSKRHYLIKTLILRNLTVQVTQANGQVKNYPALARMEFHNISDETGFPVNEIEKAILNQIMKDLFKQLDLGKIIPLIPGGQIVPTGLLPSLFK